ncbi:TPA: hypothetical protein ACH3X1_008672 [Trebouxia sp. C0004]
MCLGAAAAAAAAGGVWLWGVAGGDKVSSVFCVRPSHGRRLRPSVSALLELTVSAEKVARLRYAKDYLKYDLEDLEEDVLLKEAHIQQLQLGAGFRHSPAGLIVQDQLAAARNQQGQNAAQAQEVTRLQRQDADLHAEIANQAGIVRQSQQNRVELMQQLEAARAVAQVSDAASHEAVVHAERQRLATELASVVVRETVLVQRQAVQASAAAEEETRLVGQAQALDAQRAELQAQLAQAKQEEETRQQEVLQFKADMQQQQCNLAERESRLVSQEDQHAAVVSAKEDEMHTRSADLDRRETTLKHEQDNLGTGQAQLAEESQAWIQDRASSKAWVLKHKGLLSKREGELNRREEGIIAHKAEVDEHKFQLDEVALIRRRDHEKKEKDLTARQAALQHGEQQLHAAKPRLAALEETLKVCSANQHLPSSVSATFVPAVQLQDDCDAAAEEYEVKSKACEAAAMNSKKEVAAILKEKSALQQQLKEERQAHAKACQQQQDKHAFEVQDGQKRTTSASPTASLTQLEGPVPAADRGLTPPPPPGLARPSSTASPSSKTIGSTEGHASLSSGMPTAHSQPGRQLQGTRGSGPALAPAARGGFGSTLRPDLLRRLGNGDGNSFGEQASGSDRGQGGDRQADTSRPGLSNSLQTRTNTTDSIPHGHPGSELGGSNVGDGRSSGVESAPASSSTRRRGPPAHLVACLNRNPFEDDHAQADRHQIRSTAASQGSTGSGVSNRGRGRHATSGANHSHGRERQPGGHH